MAITYNGISASSMEFMQALLDLTNEGFDVSIRKRYPDTPDDILILKFSKMGDTEMTCYQHYVQQEQFKEFYHHIFNEIKLKFARDTTKPIYKWDGK